MANWVYTLNIQDLREKAKNEEITPADYMAEIVRRMRALNVADKYKAARDRVANLIEEYIHAGNDWDDADDLMESVYDWGDTVINGSTRPRTKLCWIY